MFVYLINLQVRVSKKLVCVCVFVQLWISFSLQDFVMGLSILLRGTIQEKLNWAFNLYDINKDGYITKEVCPIKHCREVEMLKLFVAMTAFVLIYSPLRYLPSCRCILAEWNLICSALRRWENVILTRLNSHVMHISIAVLGAVKRQCNVMFTAKWKVRRSPKL